MSTIVLLERLYIQFFQNVYFVQEENNEVFFEIQILFSIHFLVKANGSYNSTKERYAQLPYLHIFFQNIWNLEFEF